MADGLVLNRANEKRSRLPLPRSGRFQRAKTDQFFLFFIVKTYSQRLEACTDGQRFDCMERRDVIVALLQIVIGNRGARVMNAMQTNVA